MKKHGFRSIFSLLLAVMMVCSMLPTAAFAEGDAEEQPVVVETYTVTYADGLGGAAFAEQKTEGLLYGDQTPAFAGEPALDGYTFTGWDKEIATTVTESVTYTAQWQEVQADVQPEADGNGEIDTYWGGHHPGGGDWHPGGPGDHGPHPDKPEHNKKLQISLYVNDGQSQDFLKTVNIDRNPESGFAHEIAPLSDVAQGNSGKYGEVTSVTGNWVSGNQANVGDTVTWGHDAESGYVVYNVAPQALNTGHKIDVIFTVLYVGDEFRIGYNYGTSEKTQFVCQYKTNHSDTAYNNHTIAISDIKAAAGRASVNSGYQIVGWSKEANANPQTWGFNLTTPTACNKGTTIYLVAKNPNPTTNYTFVLNYDANGGTGAPDADSWSTTDASIRYHSFTVKDTVPTREGYTFKGWKAKDGSDTVYTGGTLCSVSQQGNDVVKNGNTWTRTLYAVWEEDKPAAPEAPSEEDVMGALKGAVQITCITPNSGHDPKVYDLMSGFTPGTVQGNASTGYTYTISVDAGSYVNRYNGATEGTGVDHALDDTSSKSITLKWNGAAWVAETDLPINFNVKCETATIPDPADGYFDDLEIQIKCDTKTDGSHDATLSYGSGTYRFVRRTEPNWGYIVFDAASYLEVYGTDYPGHELKYPNNAVTKEFEYKDGSWQPRVPEKLPTIEVVCKEEIVPPTKPDGEKLGELLGTPVKVECTTKTEHGAVLYALKDGDYGVSDVIPGEDGGFTCIVTVYAEKYVAAYVNAKGPHEFAGDNTRTIELTWNGESWFAKDDAVPVTFPVECKEEPVEEKFPVHIVIYRNGDTSKAYQTIALEHQPKGTVIDLTALNIADYYTANYTGQYDFYGWYNDGGWNGYKANPANPPAGAEKITVNGWTNIIGMVYDYEKVVYFQSAEDLAAYQKDHSKTEGLLHTSIVRHGDALPTADAPTATRTDYIFQYWSREGQTGDVTGQTVTGWTNLYANWKEVEKFPVHVMVFRNGNTEKAYEDVVVGSFPKGTVIDLTKLNIADYYTANYTGKYDFDGWYNDGTWNVYVKDLANPPAGLEKITVNGWTNIKGMVYDYENVVYFQTAEELAAYQKDHSKTEGILYTTTVRKGSALPTADAPAATRTGYKFLFWSREGQTGDVTGQTVNGWTNLYANWEEVKHVVNVVIYRNGDTSKAYRTFSLGEQREGTVIDLTALDIADYYTANYTGQYDFYGWYNDGAWNVYKADPANAPAGLKKLTVNGWTNIIGMVYDYENVVYFRTAEDLAAYQADHSKTEGILYTTTVRKGSALPTADAPTATRPGYNFLFWSREGQIGTDVTGQTVNGWTNLAGNWQEIEKPTAEELGLSVIVKCATDSTVHPQQTYALTDGIYEIGEVEIVSGVPTSTIKVNGPSYVNLFVKANQKNHNLTDAENQFVTATYADGKWSVEKTEVVFNVTCNLDMPTGEDIKAALGKIQVKCVTDGAHMVKEYDVEAYSAVTIQDASGKPVYTSTVTIPAKMYVEKYSDELGTHRLADGEAAEKVVVLEYSNKEWKLVSGTLPVSFNVTCGEVKPAAPTEKQVNSQLDVKVSCVNLSAAHQKDMSAFVYETLLPGSFDIGEVTGNAQNGYTCQITVRATQYVQDFAARAKVSHTLTGVDKKTVTLYHQGGGWTVGNGSHVVDFTVNCVSEPAVIYTVTYVDGANGKAFASQVYVGLKAGDATPKFNGTPVRAGYTFAGWSPMPSATVNGNATYTATWKLNTTGLDNVPKTGDNGLTLALSALLLFSFCGAAACVICTKKRG